MREPGAGQVTVGQVGNRLHHSAEGEETWTGAADLAAVLLMCQCCYCAPLQLWFISVYVCVCVPMQKCGMSGRIFWCVHVVVLTCRIHDINMCRYLRVCTDMCADV